VLAESYQPSAISYQQRRYSTIARPGNEPADIERQRRNAVADS
jgi:hypothetical protein